MDRKNRIITQLKEQFSPDYLQVEDESALHNGHAGARPEGQTHYRVVISSAAFTGLSRVAVHQRIYAALDAEFEGGLHALAIEAKAPLV